MIYSPPHKNYTVDLKFYVSKTGQILSGIYRSRYRENQGHTGIGPDIETRDFILTKERLYEV